MTLKTVLIPAAVLLQITVLADAARAEGDRPFAFSAMVGAVYAPTYEGSDRSEASGLIDFNVSFADGRFFAGTRGIGYAPVLTEAMTLKVALGYGGGRLEKDDPTNLRGLGDIDGEALAILSAEYRLSQVSFGADLKAGDDYGVTADLKLATMIEISDRVTLGGDIGAIYADGTHAQRYFGVTTAQSAASGKSVYGAGAGFKSAGIGLNVSFAMTEATAVTLGARYDELLGDAADSPITQDKAQASTFLGISARF
jgi:MipA family protein